MANGKEHTKMINKTTPVVFFIGILLSYILSRTKQFNIVVFMIYIVAFYKIGDTYLSPDLDLKSNPYYNWRLLRFIWIPYQKVIKHRSVVSHGFILGTIIRVAYLYIVFSLMLISITNITLYTILANTTIIIEKYDVYFVAALIGLELSSICHICLDIVSTMKKRKKSKAYKKGSTRKGSILI